jgi:molybdopterin/thiamine biosynthesis adenylyltransferase
MDFTNDQIERYSRHILLKDIGGIGQKKLLESRVLIIGAGGTGFADRHLPGCRGSGYHRYR